METTTSPNPDVIVSGSAAGFAQKVQTGSHQFVSDEPVSYGGKDTGPGPYDLLLAALGSCTSMTVGWYARAKKIPLEDVRVELRHSKIHAVDCAECETRTGKIDRIEMELALTGNITDEQRARLLQIANQCPVHKTLKNEIDIQAKLA
ncbi:MAG: OsmC family protein [Verrucomicrobiota bacterium]|nr:OsmC family protein [Verrucomicrobiota bacterium]